MAEDLKGIKQYASSKENQSRADLAQLLEQCPIPKEQLLSNLGLFLESKNLSRLLFMDFLYRQIINTQGIVMEFGTRWGQNMALFAALRGIYEPFNRHRKLVAFDTFRGFPSVHEKDGKSEMIKKGNLTLTDKYEDYLAKVLSVHEKLNPLDHLQRFELRVGDATKEIELFLKEQPQTIIALAYFDFDLYEPTKKCLEAIRDRVTRGTVIGFDELNDPDSPGETIALMETFGLRNVRLQRFPYASRVSYFVVE